MSVCRFRLDQRPSLDARHFLTTLLTAVVLFSAVSCGSDNPASPAGPIVPPDPISDPGSILVEHPGGFCLPHDIAGDTLWVHNRGKAPLEWVTALAPAGSDLGGVKFTVEPGTVAAVVWSWNPTSGPPSVDSLVAFTSDPEQSRLVIPFRRVDDNHREEFGPPAPIWITEGPVNLILDVPQTIEWTRVSDCSGIDLYEMQFSRDPSFSTCPTNCGTLRVGITTPQIVAESTQGDQGRTYVRVRATALDAPDGPWSEVMALIARRQ